MKHISNNHITSISAGSYTQNFEPSYLLDEHPKRLWKASSGINIETLTAEISYGCSDIAIFGTNAVSASVSVYDPNAMEWGSNDVWGGEIGDSIPAIDKIVKSSVNLVDIFIYDTKKDSDGGAWVDSATTQSWYTETLNTATRGATRPFPAIALIVAETDTITIYDATNSDCPMWMVFEGDLRYSLHRGAEPLTSIAIKNGLMTVGSSPSGGMSAVSFIHDESVYVYTSATLQYAYHANLTGRNTIGTEDILPVSWMPTPLANRNVNDIVMTVLPGVPIGSETGIKVPTIAVATDGGVSVIDGPAGVGTVKDFVDVTGDDTSDVIFDLSGNLYYTNETQGNLDMFLSTNLDADSTTPDNIYDNATIPALLANITATKHGLAVNGEKIIIGHATGITRLYPDTTTQANGMVAYVDKDFATPRMVGDVELCLSGENLIDKSIAGTTVTGTATHAVINSGELQATTATSDLTATVTTGKYCYGWEKISGTWYFRELLSEWVGASESGGTLTIANGTEFTRLVYTNTEPSDNQLSINQALDAHLFENGALMLLQGTSNNVQGLSSDEEKQLLYAATTDGTTIFRGVEAVDYIDVAGTPTSDDHLAVSSYFGEYSIVTASEVVYNKPITYNITPDEWANTEIDITGTFEQRSFSEALWIELDEIVGRSVIADIILTGPGGEPVSAGVIRAAISNDYNVTSPETGINEGRRDFSIETQLQNGARYYKKRDIVRTFSGTIHMDTTEWYKLAQSYDTIGAQPTAWNLTTLPGTDWLIFGYIDNITGNHILDTTVQANITIIEVI